MRTLWIAACLLLLPGFGHGQTILTCGFVEYTLNENPGIDMNIIMSRVSSEWRYMDKATVARHHAAIEDKMISNIAYFHMLDSQCDSDPAQDFDLVVKKVYLQARRAIDGY